MSLKDLLFRNIIPPQIKKLLITIFILFFLFIIYYFIIDRMYYGISFSFLTELFSWAEFKLVVALLMGILYLLIDAFLRKRGTRAIVPAIQVFVGFSALQYLQWAFLNSYFGVHVYLGGIVPILVYFISILPELTAFFGCTMFRKHRKTMGSIFIALTIILAIEILPLRMIFFYNADFTLLMRPSDPENIIPYGKEDRVYEFERSFKIIDELSEKSLKQDPEILKEVIIYFPKLKEYPDILEITPSDAREYWTWQYWDELDSAFVKKEMLLDLNVDSDDDGLTDFQEAELLSDAYNADTDGDGMRDGDDTDPLNAFLASDYADIKSLVLQELEIYPNPSALYLIDNQFYNGHGEFNSIANHVVLLAPDHINKWNVIFGEQYLMSGQRSLFGQRLTFGKYVYDSTGQLVLIGVVQHHGVWADSSGIVFLLMKIQGKWQLLARRQLWI